MNHRLETVLHGFIDGTDQSVLAKTFRAFTLLMSIPYSWIIRIRNFCYDHGVFKETHVACKTIAVGNLSLGGVGKTPFIGFLTQLFLEIHYTPGLISRGYKAKEQKKVFKREINFSNLVNIDLAKKTGTLNDEAQELALRFPSTPHYLGHDRIKVANTLLTIHPEIDVLLLDDAFQHRQIARDLDILLLDALNPFGGGKVVPSGFLREPLSSIKRADVILLNRADFIQESERNNIRSYVSKLAPKAFWGEIAQVPRDIFTYEFSNVSDEYSRATSISKRKHTDYREWQQTANSNRFVAFCGLGAPAGFQKTLSNAKLNIASFVAFPDHYTYSDRDFVQLQAEATRVNASAFLVTVKDFVKLEHFAHTSKYPIFALGIGVKFITGEREFIRLLQTIPTKDN